MTTRHARSTIPNELLEPAYERVRDQLVAAIRKSLPAIRKAQVDAAETFEIDPLFLNWFITTGRKWPALIPRKQQVLRAVQDIMIWFGEVPVSWDRMDVPVENQDSVDDAMQAVAKLVEDRVLSAIQQALTDALWAEFNIIVAKLDEANALLPNDLTLLLLSDFTRRLTADRFQGQGAVQKVADLLT